MNRCNLSQLQIACKLVQRVPETKDLVFFWCGLVFLEGEFQLVHFEVSLREDRDRKCGHPIWHLPGLLDIY